jgi:hypothetical protein
MKRAALVVVALIVLPGAATLGVALGAPAASAATAAPCQADGDHVAVVVDFGDSVSQQCVAFSSGDNGMDVIASRVRLNNVGLVCAIDGFPSTGCGEQTADGHYAYWSYWHGTASGGWQYASSGPASGRVAPTTVQGWRWQAAGAAKPSDPPPRASADPSATCPPEPSPSTEASTPTSTADPVTVPTPAAPVRAPLASTTITTTTAADLTSTSESGASSTSNASSGRASSSPSSGAAAGATVHDAGSGGAGSPVGIIVGVGLVGAVGAGALVSTRRRAIDAP